MLIIYSGKSLTNICNSAQSKGILESDVYLLFTASV